MFTQRNHRSRSWTPRRAALATGVIAALAFAAPGAEANAATHVAAPAPAVASDRGSAIGPTIVGSVFNGGTVLVTSPGPAVGSVVGAP